MSSVSGDSHAHLNGHGILAIIVFSAVSLVVIRPLRVRVPLPLVVSKVVRRVVGVGKGWVVVLKGRDEREGRDRNEGGDKDRPSAASGTFEPPRLSNAGQHVDNSSDSGNGCSPSTLPLSSHVSPVFLTIALDHVTAPVLGVLFLLVTRTIGGEEVRIGIVGQGQGSVRPYDVLVLFISLAYIAISLDATGLLRYLAFHVAQKGGTNGRRLYLLLYAFFFVAGTLVGNDPVILSGTAFLVYFTRVAGIIPPSAWIMAQFAAANVSSAILVSSNPTNLVVVGAYNIPFPTYTLYMLSPTAASGVVTYLLLRYGLFGGMGTWLSQLWRISADMAVVEGRERRSTGLLARLRFRTKALLRLAICKLPISAPRSETEVYISSRIVSPDVSPRTALIDPHGAVFGGAVMAVTLAVLVGTSVIQGVRVWMVALPGAALMLTRDVVHDLRSGRHGKVSGLRTWLFRLREPKMGDRARKDPRSTGTTMQEAIRMEDQSAPLDHRRSGAEVDDKPRQASLQGPELCPLGGDSRAEATPTDALSAHRATETNVARHVAQLPKRLALTFPTVSVVMSRLPLPLVPFAFGMFILVQALEKVGFIDILASGLGKVCRHGVGVTVFFIGFLSLALCNLCNNIGVTILFTKAFLSPNFASHLRDVHPALSPSIALTPANSNILKAALLSLAFGSNVGALGGAFAASLAGLLWRDGLRQGGIQVRARTFAAWSIFLAVPSAVVGFAVLVVETTHFHQI